MKLCLFIFVIHLAVVFCGQDELVDFDEDDARIALVECLKNHHVDPDAEVGFEDLSDIQKGCAVACSYRALNWYKPDGSLDIDQFYPLLVGEMSRAEFETRKEKYLKTISSCKSKAGNDDCELFDCLKNEGFNLLPMV